MAGAPAAVGTGVGAGVAAGAAVAAGGTVERSGGVGDATVAGALQAVARDSATSAARILPSRYTERMGWSEGL